jgi:cytochrome c-type biogenesis protein CcmE
VPNDVKTKGVEPGKAPCGWAAWSRKARCDRGGRRDHRFIVTDGKARSPSRFKGIVPSLFVEGSGVVAEGKRSTHEGTFVADNLLAKHDEKYVPREMEGHDPRDTHQMQGCAQTR